MIRFPDGAFRLERHHAWLWADAIEGERDEGVHPGVAVMIALRGSGASIADVMAHLEVQPQRVLFGELGLAFDRPLAVGTDYRIETEIVSIERKSGRRFASFDRVALDYRLNDRAGNVAAVRQIWIVDRT